MRLLLVFAFALAGYSTGFSQLRAGRFIYPDATAQTLYDHVKQDLDFIQPAAGEVIADVGSYDGLYPVMYALFSDSVAFYINDNDTSHFKDVDTLCLLGTRVTGKPITSRFYFTVASDTATNLPAYTFDKIIVRETLHHFSNKDKMLRDIKTRLKPGGKLVLFEPVVPGSGEIDSPCTGLMHINELMDLMEANGFALQRTEAAKNNRHWFVFVAKE